MLLQGQARLVGRHNGRLTTVGKFGPGSVIENAIVDKNARIGRDVQLVNQGGRQDAEGAGWVIRDGIIVLPKNTIVPDGTVV